MTGPATAQLDYALRVAALARVKERGCTCDQPDLRIRDFDRMTILQEIHTDQACRFHIGTHPDSRTLTV